MSPATRNRPTSPSPPGAFQPFFRGYYDAFVTKFTPAGNALVYSTFVGGSLNPPYGDDEAFDIAVDGAGQAHITGKTNSPDFPIVRAVQAQKADVYDAFVTKLNATGAALVYSTYLGGHFNPPYGTGEDCGQAILIDGAGNAVIGGGTGSFDFPVANAYQPQSAGESDGFIAKLSGSNPLPTGTPTAIASRTATATAPPATTSRTATPSATAPAGGATRTPAASATRTPGASATPGGATATPCAITFSDVHTTRLLLRAGALPGLPRRDQRLRRRHLPPVQQRPRAARWSRSWCSASAADPDPRRPSNTFADVPLSIPFYQVIETAAAHGIVSGYTCGGPGEPCDARRRPYFRPYADVTRGQLSKIAVNAAGWPLQTPATPTFSDVAPASAFYSFVETAVCHGVVSGYADGAFRPSANATRGQISKIVSLAITAGGSCRP